MFNNFLGGLSSGGSSGGGGDALPTRVNEVTFDKFEATTDFANQLGPPLAADITQTQVNAPTAGDILGLGGGMNPPPAPPPQQAGAAGLGGRQQATGDSAYSGIDSVIQKLGGKMYDPATIQAELAVQLRGTPGNLENRTSFRKFVVNVQEFQVYLAMLGNQTHVSMIHTPGVYYSLASTTSTYQGKVLAFIGDRRATKKTTPICLPTTKTWDWHTGDAVMDFDKFSEFHDVEANKGNLWMPTVGDGVPAELKVPNLVAIPNMLFDLLHNQGSAVTPYDVLASIDDFVQQSGEPGHHWEYFRKWCLVAGQANANGKSKMCLDTTPVTVDDEDFDRWVGTRLDIAFGPRPQTAAGPSAGVKGINRQWTFLHCPRCSQLPLGPT
jgi:hypothetical protein